MRKLWGPLCLAGFLVATMAVGCGDDDEENPVPATGGTAGAGGAGGEGGAGGAGGAGVVLDVSVCDPERGSFTLDIDNPFFPLVVGQVSVFEGEEDGTPVRLEITVLDETEEVAGVTTRVVEEREEADGELVEVSRNYFAQTEDGTVCYFGEAVDIFEPGEPVIHEGAWRADEGENKPGIIMPAEADISVGARHDQEVAPGIAEDHAKIVAIGQEVTVPAGTFDDTINVDETSPLEPGQVSKKSYARGVGLLNDGELELIEY